MDPPVCMCSRKALPLLPEWTKKAGIISAESRLSGFHGQGGFIDNLLRPILEKASGRTMARDLST